MKATLLTIALLATLAAAQTVLFRRGLDYTYEYSGVVENQFMSVSDSKSGYKFNCRLSVGIPRQDEAILKIITCRLYERLSGGGDRYTERESRVFTNKLKKYPVHIRFSEGYVVPNGITIHVDETLDVINVKRGMISALQYPSSTQGLFTGKKTISDIYGECATTFKQLTSTTITSERDLAGCKQPHFTLFQRKPFSNIQQLDGGYERIDFIGFGYQFVTTATCEYKVRNDQLKKVKCLQDHKFIHGSKRTSDGKLISFGSEITQELHLRTKRQRWSSFNLKPTRRVGLEFEFEAKHRQDATGHEIYHHVESMMRSLESRVMLDVAKHFEQLLDTTRRAPESQLTRVFRTIPFCSRCNKKQKAIMEAIYISSLKSCGTGDCISTVVKFYLDKKAGGTPLRKFLVDVMMNHDPKLSTIGHVLAICKSKRASNCVLLLSGIVRNYALKNSDAEIKDQSSPVYKSIEFVLKTFTKTCSSRTALTTTPEQQSEIIAAIKSVGNLGHLVQVYDTVASESIVSAILSCIENPILNEDLVKASILSLQKMNLDSSIRDVLLSLVKKVKASVAYRTSAFIVLIRDESRSTVTQLHDVIHDEKSTNMRTFMLSYVKNLLQSQEKSNQKVQEVWRSVIKEHEGALPELAKLMFHKSRYTELSRQFVLPLSQKDIGIQLSLTVVYEPGNLIPRSAAVNVSLTFLDKVYNIIEVGADLLGLETFTEALMGDLFGEKSTREKLIVLSRFMEHNSKSIKKVAKDAKAAKKEIEEAKKLGILDENELDWRIISALPIDFDPSIIPKNIDPVKYAKKYLRSLPPSETKTQLTKAIQEVEAEKKDSGGGDLPPGVEDIMKIVLFKPEFEYVKAAYRRLHKKMFDDVNYPRMAFPSGGFYVKTMGNEIAYITIVDVIKFLENFASMEKFLEYIDFFKLLSEVTTGKEVTLQRFYEIVHKDTVIPTLIGVPMNMTFKGVHVRVVDGKLKVTINSKDAVPNVDVIGSFEPRHAALLTGSLYVNVPTRSEYVGVHTNFTLQLYTNTDLSIKYLPRSVDQMSKPKQIKIFHKNYEEPTDLFRSIGQMCLKHWGDMEAIPGREQYRTKREKCSPPVLETLTGRKACFIAEYQNTTGVDDHPFFPLTGPFDFAYRVIPSTSDPVKRNILTVNFDKKPCPMHPKHILRVIKLQYEGEDQFGSTAKRNVETEITLNPETGNFKSVTKTPLFDEGEVNIQYLYRSGKMGFNDPTPEPEGPKADSDGPTKSWMRKDIIVEILKGGEKTYGLKYYRRVETIQKRVRDAVTGQVSLRPVMKVTLFGNYTMRDMSIQATVNNQRSLMGLDMKGDITAYYFCNLVDSPLYEIHLNPEAAKANGHWTKFTGTNKLSREMTGEKDWKLVHEHTAKYPGQDFKFVQEITTQKRGSVADGSTDISYIDSESVPQTVEITEKFTSTMNMRLHAKEIEYNMDIRHVGRYEATVKSKITATALKITCDTDVDYRKTLSRRKRSLSDTLWSVERRLVDDFEYVRGAIANRLYHTSSVMSDTGDYVDWSNWKAKGKLVINNHLGYIRSSDGSSLDATLDVTYPRQDKYHDIKANMLYQGQKYSFRPGHGKHNLTFGLTSSFLESGVDMGMGYDGQLFGEKFRYKEYIIINDLKTGEQWPLVVTIYDRSQTRPRMKLVIDHKFKTLRTDYKFYLFHEGIMTKDLTTECEIRLKSDIAPVLDHSYKAAATLRSSVLKGTAAISCAWFDFDRNVMLTLPSRANPALSLTENWTFKPYTGEIYDIKLVVRFNPRGQSNINFEATEQATGTIYSFNADMINPKKIVLKTYKQERGQARDDGLTVIVNKINPHQVEHVMSWSPRFGDMMYKRTSKTIKYLALRWSNMAIMFLSNVNKPFMEKVLPYSDGMTIGEVYEKHMKPRMKAFITEMNAYKLFGRPIGDLIKERILKFRAVRLHSMKMLRETVIGRFLFQLKPVTRTRYLIGETLPWIIRYWQKNPPEILTGYFNRAYRPKIEKIRAERKYTLVISHPFIQESFTELPKLRAWAGSLKAWLGYMSRKTYTRKGPLAQALTFGSNYVYTFDGRIFSIPESSQSCAYLLSSDFKYAKYSIIKTDSRVTFYSKQITFSIDKDNKVYLDESRVAAEMPIVNGSLSISNHGGLLSALLPSHGVSIYCDRINKICGYEITHKHYNHSLGLLGSNDEEYLTDFYIPNGERTENVHTFLNQYDVSGRCRHNENAFRLPSETRRCTQPAVHCADAFTSRNSPLAKCFTVVPANEFLDACNFETSKCRVRNPGKVACSFIQAYTHLCQAKGLDVGFFPKCVVCHGHTLGSHSWSERVTPGSVDYAVVVATSAGMVGQASRFPTYITDLLDKIHTTGSTYALITFNTEKTTIHGDYKRPFGSLQRLKYRLGREKLSKTGLNFGADINAAHQAMFFPFRDNSHHRVILFTDTPISTYPRRSKIEELIKRMKENSIILHVVSVYDSIDNADILALGRDGVIPKPGMPLPVALPLDELGEAVYVTNGYLFNRKQMIRSRGNYHRSVANLIKSRNVVPKGKCRKCKCSAGDVGQGLLVCEYVNC